jgi:tRNA(adenine34) deaminase
MTKRTPKTFDESPFPKSLKESLMREALREAELAMAEGEAPVGALVTTMEGEIVARAHNRVIALSDPSAHAEILALREAGRKLSNYRLVGLALFVTVEPCAMCVACSLQARLKGIVYGAPEPKWGACHEKSVIDLNAVPGQNHRLEFLEGGLLADEAASLMVGFFKGIRESRKKALP